MPRKAERLPRGTKTEAVRKVFGDNPQMKPKDVVDFLSQQGMSVSRNQVYIIKNEMQRRGRKAKRALAVEAGRSAGLVDAVTAVTKVRSLAGEVGGMKNLKKIVDLMAE